MKSLFDKLVAVPNISGAWHSLNKRPHSHGIDNVDIEEFQRALQRNLASIRKDLKRGQFEFQKLRGRLIEKTEGKKRPLRIATVGDRVVQRAILNVIERYFKKFNLPCSFAYIKDRSREDAVGKIIEYRDRKNWYVLESDIISFFERIDRSRLLRTIFAELPDTSLNNLIEKSLDTTIGNADRYTANELERYFPSGNLGISQGGILSPLFANIYLEKFDRHMLNNRFNLIRYADDFVIITKERKTAMSAYATAKDFLKNELGLDIHELSDAIGSKTRITTFGEGFSFLGVSFNHKTITPSEKSRQRFKTKILELTSPDKRFTNLTDALGKLRLTILGWCNAYSFCHEENLKYKNDVVQKIFEALDAYVSDRLNILLKHCDLRPKKDRLRGFHLSVLGVPSLTRELHSSMHKSRLKPQNPSVPALKP